MASARLRAITSGFGSALVGVADDHDAAPRILLQARGHVVQAGLVHVVEARQVAREAAGGAGHGLRASASRGTARCTVSVGLGRAAAAVGDPDGHGDRRVAGHRRAVEGGVGAVARHPAGARRPGVGQGIAVGIGRGGAARRRLARPGACPSRSSRLTVGGRFAAAAAAAAAERRPRSTACRGDSRPEICLPDLLLKPRVQAAVVEVEVLGEAPGG